MHNQRSDIQELCERVWEGGLQAAATLREQLFLVGEVYLQSFRLSTAAKEDIIQKHISLLISRLIRQEKEMLRNAKAYFITCIKRDAVREVNRMDQLRSIDEVSHGYDFPVENLEEVLARKDELARQINKLREVLPRLTQKCRDFIDSFFFQGKNHPQVAIQMRWDGPSVSKVRKSQCLGQLKKLFFS